MPAINNGNISFFVLANNTQSISFKVESGPHHWGWWYVRLRLMSIVRRCVCTAASSFMNLLILTMLFFHHRVLPSDIFLFFACVYRGFSCAFLTFITEKCTYTCDKVALFKHETRIYMVLE